MKYQFDPVFTVLQDLGNIHLPSAVHIIRISNMLSVQVDIAKGIQSVLKHGNREIKSLQQLHSEIKDK